MRVVARFGLPNVVQHFLGLWLGSLGQIVQDIAGLMHPTALLACGWEDFFQSCPEAHSTITGGQFGGGEPTGLEAEKNFAPTLGAFADTVFNGKKMLLASRIASVSTSLISFSSKISRLQIAAYVSVQISGGSSIGAGLNTRKMNRQITENQIATKSLNRMTRIGRAVFKRAT